jgi:hypothetical protein
LTLTFSQAITTLSAADITLSGVSGITKGTLSSSGAIYTLPISGFTAGGTLSVAVAKSGYTISGSPKQAIIYYNGSSDGSGGKTITITGVPNTIVKDVEGEGFDAVLYVYTTTFSAVAHGKGNYSNNALTIPLFAGVSDSTPYTGSGSYILFLAVTFSDDPSGDPYVYTNGQTLSALGITSMVDVSKLPKYNISTTTSTINFNLFKQVPAVLLGG